MEDFFRLNIRSMIPIGIWPFPNETKHERYKQILFYTNAIFVLTLACSEFWQGIDNYKNIILLAEGVSAGAATITNIIKVSVFFYRREFIRQLFTLIQDLYEHTPIEDSDNTVSDYTNKWKIQAQSIVKFLATIYVSTWLAYMVFPWYGYFQHGKLVFPVPSKFPFDISRVGIYLLMYLWIFIGGVFVLLIFIANETLFTSLIMFICSRIEILEYSIFLASTEATDKKTTTTTFKKSIIYHRKILRLCEMMESLYSPVLFVQFFSSATSICMMCFLTTLNKIEKSKQFTFVTFLASLLVQLFVYCYFGQLLQSKFEKLRNVGFNSSWYTAPVSYQKNILFFIMRCTRPVTLTAFRLMPANLHSYFTICKTCLSYLAILQSLEEEQTI